MDPRMLAQRSAVTRARLMRAAEALAKSNDLQPQLTALAHAVHREPALAALLQLEAVTDLLETLAGTKEESAPVHVVNTFMYASEIPSPSTAVDVTIEGNKSGPIGPLPPARVTPSLDTIDGIGPELAAALAAINIKTLDDLRAASDQTLLGVAGINKTRLKKLRAQLDEAE